MNDTLLIIIAIIAAVAICIALPRVMRRRDR
jgi:hypothetical protein